MTPDQIEINVDLIGHYLYAAKYAGSNYWVGFNTNEYSTVSNVVVLFINTIIKVSRSQY